MLGPNGGSAQSLRRELGAADDEKIGKIIAYVDQVGDAEVNRTLLDPLRGRLASLRPERPLRLSRLLFIPLDRLIVPPLGWKPDSTRVPRTALAPMTALVRATLGEELAGIDQAIKGRTTGAIEVIARAGETLWPRAAAILANAAAPPQWRDTELPEGTFRPLAAAVATVLRRGTALQRLMRYAEAGRPDEEGAILGEVMLGLAGEPAEGAAMVAQLVLLHAPPSAARLRSFVTATRESAESAALNRALARGIDQSLGQAEQEASRLRKMPTVSLREASEQVRDAANLLEAIEADTTAGVHRQRIRAVREQLDQASRACFSNGLHQRFTQPLADLALGKLGATQKQLESTARDLRGLETVARRLGEPSSYDRHLEQSADAVRTAYGAGQMTLPRACRLLEILSGPETAHAFYSSAAPEAAPP